MKYIMPSAKPEGSGLAMSLLSIDEKYLEKNKYSSEVFARGYVLSQARAIAPEGWSHGKFGDLHFAHDPRLQVIERKTSDLQIICMGIINDVRHPTVSEEAICERLIDALVRSEEDFFDLLSFTCGRYAIAWRREGETWLTVDATGMKSAYYSTDGSRIVASHVRLVAWNMQNAKASAPVAMKFGYPGIRTPVENVFILTPNARLRLSDGRSFRFWPKDKLAPLDLASAISEAGDHLQGAFDHYAHFFTPLVSVTAGLDSRVALAMSKGTAPIEHFTYYRNDTVDTDLHDKAFCKSFAELSHRDVALFSLGDFDAPHDDFKEIQGINTIYNHIKKLAWVYYRKYSERKDLIHVRSNISEVGREFYRAKKFPVETGKDLARVYLYGDKQYTARYVFNMISRFEEFDSVTGLTGCKDLVDVKSLFYWEFRMVSWHSGVVLESDPAFETVSIYNCRRILEILLSVDREERLKSSILRHVIAEKWPELAEYDVNGKPFWG